MAIYLHMEKCPGESIDSGHTDWIDLMSYSMGISRPVTGGHAGVSRGQSAADFSEIHLTKAVDLSSTKLAEACAKGTSFKVVKIDFTTSYGDSKRECYMKIELNDALVTSYTESGGGEGAMSESISLNFTKIKKTYSQRGKDGKGKGNCEMTWDVEKGTP